MTAVAHVLCGHYGGHVMFRPIEDGRVFVRAINNGNDGMQMTEEAMDKLVAWWTLRRSADFRRQLVESCEALAPEGSAR